jgi:hypothetical protein
MAMRTRTWLVGNLIAVGVAAAQPPADVAAAAAADAALREIASLDLAQVRPAEFAAAAERFAAALAGHPAAEATRAAAAVLVGKADWQEVLALQLGSVAGALQQQRLAGIAWFLPAVLTLQLAAPKDPRWHYAEFETFVVDSAIRDPARAAAALGRFLERLGKQDPLATQWRTMLEYFGEPPGERTLDEAVAAFTLHRRFVAALLEAEAPVRQLSALDVRVLFLQQSAAFARRRGNRAEALQALGGWATLQPGHPVAALFRGAALASGAENRELVNAHKELDRFLALTKSAPAAGDVRNAAFTTPELLAILAVLDGPSAGTLADLRAHVETLKKQREPLLFCPDRKWLERQVIALERDLRNQAQDLHNAEQNEQECAYRVERREQEIAGLRGGSPLKLSDAQNRLIGERSELERAQKGLEKARQDEAAARARLEAHRGCLEALEK